MKPSPMVYAGRLERFFAHLLDTLVLMVGKLTLMGSLGDGGIVILFAFLLDAAYYIYFLSSAWQATPGQRLLSIFVVRSNGGLLNRDLAAFRFICFVLPALPIYASFLPEAFAQSLMAGLVIFWFAPILFTEQRAGLHDQLTHTRVVVGKAEDRKR